MDIIYPIYI